MLIGAGAALAGMAAAVLVPQLDTRAHARRDSQERSVKQVRGTSLLLVWLLHWW